jgi:hypothetical protein
VSQALHDQAERHHEERRKWHEAAMEQSDKANASHESRLTSLVLVAAMRPLIELAILIVLLVKL